MASARSQRGERTASSQTYTGPVEDYLKAIYELERSTGSATTKDIAQRLDVAPPSATWMVRRLAGQGLLRYERYRGARLTERGHRAALRIVRRHRVIETYLARKLGYSWDKVHEEAERLEHAASDELVDRMATMLDEPRVDPHGAPIPTRDGTIVETKHSFLSDLVDGDRARVIGVSDEDPARLRYLAELGLVPGTLIAILGRAPFDGPITVRVGRGQPKRTLGPVLARAILVEPIRP
jgi:DtxR family Mn-dependent transcriptional regulator